MNTSLRVLMALCAAAPMAACVAPTPVLDARFGESVTIMQAQQTRDPDASRRNEDRPVDGMEGRAARETMDRYYKSFSERNQPGNALTINIGSGGTSSGGQ